MDFLSALHRRSRNAPESGIMEIINYGVNREGLIPLWTGEGDMPTPGFACVAVEKSLKDGETFYTYQRGIPELRQALADYHTRVYSKEFSPERFFVTGSGMQAIQLCVQAVTGPGDEVLVPTPAWPNFSAALGISGGVPVEVPMDFSRSGWSLDMEKVESVVTDKTKAIFLNSPSNPTGWVASHSQLKGLLDLARRRGLWIIADEVYGLYYFRDDMERAPSFYDVMLPEDRILFPNTMSKNWAMTGWRVGWISAPAELGNIFENLILHSTSGVAAFMQRGCVEVLNEGDDFLRQQIENAGQARKFLSDAFENNARVRFAIPDGAFYFFFAIDNSRSSMDIAKSLVDEVAVGLAPGSAFGSGGEGFLRLCFARRSEIIGDVVNRIFDWLDL